MVSFLIFFSPFYDGGIPTEVVVGISDIVEALVITMVVVVIDKGGFRDQPTGNSTPARSDCSAFDACAQACPGSADDAGRRGHD